MKNQNIGKIIIPGNVRPEVHELEVAHILAEVGLDVEFLLPSYIKGLFSPDLLMNGQIWEMKSPCGSSKRTIENNYRNAQKQSENIIFDLRRVKLDEKVVISQIKQRLLKQRNNKTKRTIIITKNKKILDFKR